MYTQSNAEDIGVFQEDALSAAAVVEAVNASGASVDQADRSGKATGLALLQAVAFNCNGDGLPRFKSQAMSYFGLIGYSLVKQTLDGIFRIFDALHIFVSQSPHLRVVLNIPTMKVVAAKFIGPY